MLRGFLYISTCSRQAVNKRVLVLPLYPLCLSVTREAGLLLPDQRPGPRGTLQVSSPDEEPERTPPGFRPKSCTLLIRNPYPNATAPAIARPRAADLPRPLAAVRATVLLRVFSEIPSMNFKTALACVKETLSEHPEKLSPPSGCRGQAGTEANQKGISPYRAESTAQHSLGQLLNSAKTKRTAGHVEARL